MIIQLHTPKGIVEVDSETVTDEKLAKINMDRQRLNSFLAMQPRDYGAEIDKIKTRLDMAELR